MHLYVVARGIKTAMDQWVSDTSAIFLPMKYDKDKPNGRVRLAVRPIQIYEIVFPEEQLNYVLGAIPQQGGDPKKNRWIKTAVMLMRKFLKVKAPPEVKPNGAIFAPYLAINHIGIKKDERDKNGIELL